MLNDRKIGRAFERNAKAMELRPSIGRGTAVTRVRVEDGLRCTVEDGAWTLVADLGEAAGGSNAGPNPGVFGRTALGTCLAMNYVLWASRLEFPITSLEVEVQADYDSRGYHGVGDVAPGYEQVRYLVSISSTASEQEVSEFLDEADSHCDFLHVFSRPQDVRRTVRLGAS